MFGFVTKSSEGFEKVFSLYLVYGPKLYSKVEFV
jgi:hypothetical protein